MPDHSPGPDRAPRPTLADLEADPRVLWNTDVLRFSDTDMNAHVNNAAFSVFCESGRVHALRTRVRPLCPPGSYFVLAKLAIAFQSELHFPGTVRIATWIAGLGRTSVTFGQALFRDDDVLAATADGVTVCMDGATRRPQPHGDATREAVGPLLRS